MACVWIGGLTSSAPETAKLPPAWKLFCGSMIRQATPAHDDAVSPLLLAAVPHAEVDLEAPLPMGRVSVQARAASTPPPPVYAYTHTYARARAGAHQRGTRTPAESNETHACTCTRSAKNLPSRAQACAGRHRQFEQCQVIST